MHLRAKFAAIAMVTAVFLAARPAFPQAFPDSWQEDENRNPYELRREQLKQGKKDESPAPPLADLTVHAPPEKISSFPAKPFKVYIPNPRAVAAMPEPHASPRLAAEASITILDHQLNPDAPEFRKTSHPKVQAQASLPVPKERILRSVAGPFAALLPQTAPSLPSAALPLSPSRAPLPHPVPAAAAVPLPVTFADNVPAPSLPSAALASASAAPPAPKIISSPAPTIVVKRSVADFTNPSKPVIRPLETRHITPEELAALAPAAGQPAPPVTPPEVASALTHELSEPMPTLSNSTRIALTHIPSKLDTPPPKKITHVELDRTDIKSPPDANIAASAAPDEPKRNAFDKKNGLEVNIGVPALDVNYELERAYNALMSGNADAAIDIYSGVLNNNPDNQQALFGLATAYQRAGQNEKARPLYIRLLKINPTHRGGLNNFLALAADEAPEQALQELQQVERKSPDFSPIPAQEAMIYEKMGQTDEAISKMSRAASLAPENMTYRYDLAILFDKAHRWPEAEALYRQVLEAGLRGESIPGDVNRIQQRLTFIGSNRS